MDASSRYQKQMLFHGIGEAGQRKLKEARVLLVGCGALGCVVADAMTRAGVGHLRIVDRDFVEISNLQRQVLFTEADVHAHLPKAVVAGERLRQINSDIVVETHVADVDHTNICELAAGCDLILDGTDNFEIRYLINDVALELNIPWIFTGCTGSHGQLMPVFPHRTACLRCLMPNPPPPGTTETCDTAGVLGPAIGVIASMQAAMALKILTAADGQSPEEIVPLKLTIVDVWDLTFRQVDVSRLRERSDCPACRHAERLWLGGQQRSGSTVLCGRNAVQISPPQPISLAIADISHRLSTAGQVTENAFLVRVDVADSPLQMTVFPDGRAIVKGTEDPAAAKALYSRYIGG